MSDPQILIFRGTDDRRNRGGRPRAAQPRSTVCTWLPAEQHDRLIEAARQRGGSVSALVRSVLLAQQFMRSGSK